MAELSDRTAPNTSAAVLEIYRPIIRGYFAVFATYYTAMIPTHFWSFEGIELFAMASVAALAAVTGIGAFLYLRRPARFEVVERLLMAMNFLVVSNIVVALNLQFSPEKLIYFVIVVMAFTLASVSLRQSILSILLATVALFTYVPRLDTDTFVVYCFLVFGAAMASVAITFFLRKAIVSIAGAKVEAEEQLEDARKVSANLRQKSLSDSLTGLPNRRAFFEELGNAKAGLANSGTIEPGNGPVWLMLVDLDGFKAVNDVHGHLVGDLLLQEVAQRLTACCSEGGHVSRIGGDEFNIILNRSGGEQEIRDWCNGLLEALSKPYRIEGRSMRISGSLGCKMFEPDRNFRSQINQADYALMEAKKQGKNRAVIFGEEHAKRATERYNVERALRMADLDKELQLVFQPQFDLTLDRIVRAEVLARWSSPVVGKIKPTRFIKLAEESGLITDITLVVVRKAFSEIATWTNPIPISINLSSHDVITDPIIEQIIRLAEEYEVDPGLIEFEVTETAMMADMEKASANLERISELGFSIALDDFGTGYSNFNYLRTLPIGKLKVDRSFMENPGDPMTEKVLFSLTGMARTLGVHCLLEGIENEIDLVIAKRVGAESVQGFLFGAPMNADELESLIAARSRIPENTLAAG